MNDDDVHYENFKEGVGTSYWPQPIQTRGWSFSRKQTIKYKSGTRSIRHEARLLATATLGT